MEQELRPRGDQTLPPELRFDETAHRYTFQGNPIPSVTTILKDMGAVDFSFATEAARERGSTVHQAVHYSLEGDLAPESLDPRLAGYVAAAHQFLQDVEAETLAVEQRLFSARYSYAGTADWVGYIRGRKYPAVVDWKTASSGKPVPGVALQLAGYAEAWNEQMNRQGEPLPAVAHRYAVVLSSEGRYTLTRYEDPSESSVFRSLVLAWWWRARHVKNVTIWR